ncbi:hypothetical protein RchiOBHm_Chr6g0284501 [Rosa chinensis]|uniref:Uncharacterized protein n=1 Tax=Rosa chinensis TaxID=74649 RepID=A0A2P6PUB5_ROSCH|nr:hypothetical protein RchiOBHm_Chr6g0284501 [Rosa chinensis]
MLEHIEPDVQPPPVVADQDQEPTIAEVLANPVMVQGIPVVISEPRTNEGQSPVSTEEVAITT